jgi:hypothetical protein
MKAHNLFNEGDVIDESTYFVNFLALCLTLLKVELLSL